MVDLSIATLNYQRVQGGAPPSDVSLVKPDIYNFG